MAHDLGYTKAQLGLITTIGGVTYGVSKFINGFLGDHANPRYFMAIGLFCSAVMNVFFGLSSSLLFFATFWFFNNYFQGHGLPPVRKSMAYWFSPKRTRHHLRHLAHLPHDRRRAHRRPHRLPRQIPRLALLLLHPRRARHRSAPSSSSSSSATRPARSACRRSKSTKAKKPRATRQELKNRSPPTRPRHAYATPAQPCQPETYWDIVRDYILLNPFMWVISFANLFVYVLRYAQMTWGPTFLQEAKGLSVVTSGWLSFGSEMGGMVGALVAGFIADRIFRGRAGRVCVIAMALMARAPSTLFWKAPPEQHRPRRRRSSSSWASSSTSRRCSSPPWP